jgi:hypothetical protein
MAGGGGGADSDDVAWQTGTRGARHVSSKLRLFYGYRFIGFPLQGQIGGVKRGG